MLAARGGRAGIELAQRHRPDLIALDLEMPEVSGFEVVEALRSSPDTARTLTGMLEATMTHGTGKKFFEKKGVPRLGKIRAGGKSGSLSGRGDSDTGRHYSWFVALAPIEAPEIAVAALVVNGAEWTVKGAVPARDVLAAYFGKAPDEERQEREADPLAE